MDFGELSRVATIIWSLRDKVPQVPSSGRYEACHARYSQLKLEEIPNSCPRNRSQNTTLIEDEGDDEDD